MSLISKLKKRVNSLTPHLSLSEGQGLVKRSGHEVKQEFNDENEILADKPAHLKRFFKG